MPGALAGSPLDLFGVGGCLMSDVFSRLGSRVVRDVGPAPVADPFAAAQPTRSVEDAQRATVTPATNSSVPSRVAHARSAAQPPAEPLGTPPPAAGPVRMTSLGDPEASVAETPPATSAFRPSPHAASEVRPTRSERSTLATATSSATDPVPASAVASGPEPDRSEAGAAPVVAATLRAPGPIFIPAAAESPSAAESPGRPTVQVHIGRLDVRANLVAPVSKQPERAARRSSEGSVSLGDYLAGRRVRA